MFRELGMFDKLRQMINDGMPVLATCAGLILLAEDVVGGETTFQSLPVKVCRNAQCYRWQDHGGKVWKSVWYRISSRAY